MQGSRSSSPSPERIRRLCMPSTVSVPVIKVSSIRSTRATAASGSRRRPRPVPGSCASSAAGDLYNSSQFAALPGHLRGPDLPSPDVVVASYTPGYVGLLCEFRCRFLGHRLLLSSVLSRRPDAVYYPRPYTCGAHAWYNPATSTYYRGGAWYGPYGGYGAGAAYNPATGTYRRGYGAYGPGGGYRVGQAYNPRTGHGQQAPQLTVRTDLLRAARGYNPSTGTRFAGAQGSSVYGSWGSRCGFARRPGSQRRLYEYCGRARQGQPGEPEAAQRSRDRTILTWAMTATSTARAKRTGRSMRTEHGLPRAGQAEMRPRRLSPVRRDQPAQARAELPRSLRT